MTLEWLIHSACIHGASLLLLSHRLSLIPSQAMLYMLRFPAYDDVYTQAEDNRQILGSIEDLQVGIPPPHIGILPQHGPPIEAC